MVDVESGERGASGVSPTAVREFVPVASTAHVGLWSVGPEDGSYILNDQLILATGLKKTELDGEFKKS